jgi:hypothetical protein
VTRDGSPDQKTAPQTVLNAKKCRAGRAYVVIAVKLYNAPGLNLVWRVGTERLQAAQRLHPQHSSGRRQARSLPPPKKRPLTALHTA